MTDIVVASWPNPAVNTERLFVGCDGSWVSGDSVVRYSYGLRYRRLVTAMLDEKNKKPKALGSLAIVSDGKCWRGLRKKRYAAKKPLDVCS